MNIVKHLFKFLTGQQFILYMGGGGGGTTQSTGTTYNTNIPEYAEPYVNTMLGATQKQLFNMEGNEITGFKPYTPYSKNASDYVAGFSPLQERAINTAASPEAFGREVGGYMSPYMQNVVDIQKREAMRGAGIMGAQQQAQATNAGAFGGYREGIQRAENTRNLGTQMNDIQLKGQQMAFDDATKQARANQALQMQYGTMQQSQEQQKINQSIQDFANAQQYPLMQLGVMSNMLRGLPMQAATTNQYVAAPNPITQGIGMAGAGASIYNATKGASGGLPSEFKYAEGGIATVPRFDVGGEVESQLESMGIPDLMKQAQESSSPTVRAMAKRILREKQMERGADQSAAPAGPMGVDYQAPSYAGGGIIAFAQPNEENNQSLVTDKNLSSLQQIEQRGISELTPLAEKYKAAQAGLVAAGRSGDSNSVTRYLQEQNTYRTQLNEAAEGRFGNQAPRIIDSLLAPKATVQPVTRQVSEKPRLTTAADVEARTPQQKAEQAALREKHLNPAPANLTRASATTSAPAAPRAAPTEETGIKSVAPAPATPDPAVAARMRKSPEDGTMYDPGPNAAGIATVPETPAAAAPAPAADGKPAEPVFTGPLADIKRAAWKAEQEAAVSDAEYLKRVKEGTPENTAAVELRKQIMDERANSKDEAERQRYMRMAQFFAKWGSTPGPTLAAGLAALEKSMPDIISDEQSYKKAKRELDKVIFDIDNATRLEELGNRKEARALKEKAAERAKDLNHYLIQAQSAENVADIQQKTSKYSADKKFEGDKLQAGATSASVAESRRIREAASAQTAYQAARNAVVDAQNSIARQENTEAFKENVRLAKMRNSETGKAPEGFENQVAAAEKALRDHRAKADKLINDAEADVKYTYSRLKAPENAPQGAGAVSPTAPKTMSMADVEATAKSSGRTVDEVKAAAKAKGITIK